ncbi:hypothetical protein CVT25_000448 [Psilocybe cyanescens]|uniref:Uncharacterized protein n=1 Tax=Psilocybe cyanescens TaxID=93625 RepID=A0A409XLZ8_PSICY|nr:hypothetical protein CVT25_000448 [Psilocybe cyanescens]
MFLAHKETVASIKRTAKKRYPDDQKGFFRYIECIDNLSSRNYTEKEEFEKQGDPEPGEHDYETKMEIKTLMI